MNVIHLAWMPGMFLARLARQRTAKVYCGKRVPLALVTDGKRFPGEQRVTCPACRAAYAATLRSQRAALRALKLEIGL